jgi:hypothetical protein
MNSWLGLLSSKIRAQIALDNARKAETWALLILSFVCLGFALDGLRPIGSGTYIFSAKILFLAAFHVLLLVAVYLPSLLQKREKTWTSFFGIKDVTGLGFIGGLFLFQLLVVASLAFQAASGAGNFVEWSAFSGFLLWVNFLFSAVLLATLAWYALTVFVFTGMKSRGFWPGKKVFFTFLGFHGILPVLLLFGYADIVALGSVPFFEQFRVGAFFWGALGSWVLLAVKALRQSPLPGLQNLELETASGNARGEAEILARLQDALISERFAAWLGAEQASFAAVAAQMVQSTREAVGGVTRKSLAETDIRRVEENYKKAESLSRKLEKRYQRFLLLLPFLDLTPREAERAASLRDLFSRDLRHSKLELAAIRRGLDEILLSSANPVASLSLPLPQETEKTAVAETRA